MKLRRTLAVVAVGVAVAVAPLVPAVGVQLVDVLAPVGPDPVVPEAPRLPDCDEEYRNACFTSGRDSSNRPVYEVCVRDDVIADVTPITWYTSELACAQTEHFAYLPAPGVCVGSERVSTPTACVNGNECTLWVMGAWVLCHRNP